VSIGSPAVLGTQCGRYADLILSVMKRRELITLLGDMIAT
jgi:hypothetical protein